MILVTVPL